MPVLAARWVLWISLLILMPIPFYVGSWSCLPVERVIGISYAALIGDLEMAFPAPLLVAQLLGWSMLLWMCGFFYGLLSERWSDKIRDSIMGLVVLTLLMLFSTFPVYHSSLAGDASQLNFRQLHE